MFRLQTTSTRTSGKLIQTLQPTSTGAQADPDRQSTRQGVIPTQQPTCPRSIWAVLGAHIPGLELAQLHPWHLRTQGSRGKKNREQLGSTAELHQAGRLYLITHGE